MQHRKAGTSAANIQAFDESPMESQKSTHLNSSWGRSNTASRNQLTWLIFLYPAAQLFCSFCLKTCTDYDCQLWGPITSALTGQISPLDLFLPFQTTTEGLIILSTWLILQVLLYTYLPGKLAFGIVTPAGQKLPYNINGLLALIISNFLFLLAVFFPFTNPHSGSIPIDPAFSWSHIHALATGGLVRGSIIYDNWNNLFILAMVWGNALAVFVYIKALYFPSHKQDCKFSDSVFYDFIMGVELNPRIRSFDFKLFFNGRPGIIGWCLINVSFMFAQLRIHGYISNSMFLLGFLQTLYVVDFFFNEEWYLSTIDIAHDHFGWYLAWGDSVWLPYTYTLQALFLVTHPHNMGWFEFAAVLGLGLFGYFIFRLANNQRVNFRNTPVGEIAYVWGKPATFISASYTTSDGTVHRSNLLTSGFWGISRHFNYFGDLCISFAFCATCGYTHALPFFYFFYMVGLLVYRVDRDHHRLYCKYGKKWEEYCSVVNWKIVPYIY